MISVFVGVTDFQDLVSRIDLMRRIGSSDAAVVASVKDARERIEAARSALESRKAEQVALRNRARAKRAEVEESLDEQKSYLERLDSKLKRSDRRGARAARAHRAGEGRGGSPRRLPAPGAPQVVTSTPRAWAQRTPTSSRWRGASWTARRMSGEVRVPRASTARDSCSTAIARSESRFRAPAVSSSRQGHTSLRTG